MQHDPHTPQPDPLHGAGLRWPDIFWMDAMTQRLPSTAQFLTAKNHLCYAGERALLAYYEKHETVANHFKFECIHELKKAVKALGYELVEVVSAAAEPAIAASSAAGGRMDMAEKTDA